MREIEFRGKKVSNGEWAHGYYFCEEFPNGGKYHCLLPLKLDIHPGVAAFRVEPETVGEYTGLKDKNGKKVFEGDVVKYSGKYIETKIGEVIFKNGGFKHSKSSFGYEGEDIIDLDECKIIGNVHEHPKLIKELVEA